MHWRPSFAPPTLAAFGNAWDPLMKPLSDDDPTPAWTKQSKGDAATALLNQVAALNVTLFAALAQLLGIESYHLPPPTVPAIERASALLDLSHRAHGSSARALYAMNQIRAATAGHPFQLCTRDPSVLVGRYVSGYEMRRVIGRGGTGTVYHAQKLATGERCALKLIDPLPHDSLHLLGETSDAIFGLNSVQHPSLIKIRDFATARLEDGGPPEPHGSICYFMTMEFVDGCDLSSWIRAEPEHGRRLLEVLIQLAEALSLCHEAKFEARSGVRRRGFSMATSSPRTWSCEGIQVSRSFSISCFRPSISCWQKKPLRETPVAREASARPDTWRLNSSRAGIYQNFATSIRSGSWPDNWPDSVNRRTRLLGPSQTSPGR